MVKGGVRRARNDMEVEWNGGPEVFRTETSSRRFQEGYESDVKTQRDHWANKKCGWNLEARLKYE
jgi:hypothetical protein